MELDSPPPPIHGHYAAHDRPGFADELWTRAERLDDAFKAKLDEYGCSPIEDSGSYELTGPSTEKGCCDILNSLIRSLPKCM